MHHSPLLRGCLTTLVVAAVLVLLRRAGPRAGGIAAAMPTTSLPALAWICSEHGPTFAGAAAGSALLTTALTGLIALLYAHAAPRLVPVHSLGVATLPVVTLAALCTSASCTLAVEVIAAILVLLVCRRLMPAAIAGIGPSLTTRGSNMLFPAVVAGVFTAWIGSMAPDVPAGLCGAVAAIPVIGLSATVSVHGQAGSAMVVNFLARVPTRPLGKGSLLGVAGRVVAAIPACPRMGCSH